MASKVQKSKLGGKGNTRPLPPNAGRGRVKGVPNKVTKAAREAMAQLADEKANELGEWLTMAAYGVGRAFNLVDLPLGEEPVDEGAELYKTLKTRAVWKIPLPGVNTISVKDVMDGRVPVGAVIDWVVKPDPAYSTSTMLGALEYHIPKLSRVEQTGPDGAALQPATIVVQAVEAPKRD